MGLLEKIAKKAGEKIQPGELKGGKNMPSSSAKPGEGGRFSALVKKLRHKKGVTNPEGLAAALARAKYGKSKAAHMAAAGKK